MVMVNDKRKYNKKMQCQIFKSDFQICISVPLKKRLWHMCFPVNFVKFVRKPFLIDDTPLVLLLNLYMPLLVRDLPHKVIEKVLPNS